jgi:hypothetical protein
LVDTELRAHCLEQSLSDLFLPILQGGEAITVVQSAMTALAVSDKLHRLACFPAQALYPIFEFLSCHHPPPANMFIVVQKCTTVNYAF